MGLAGGAWGRGIEGIYPADDCDAAVEAEREANARHGALHVGEEVCDEPGGVLARVPSLLSRIQGSGLSWDRK